jgi:hypothetical protein
MLGALLPPLLVNKCADQLKECLVFGAPSAQAEKLSDFHQPSPPTGAAVRLVLDHRHTGLRIPDQPPDVAVGAFVENSRRHVRSTDLA